MGELRALLEKNLIIWKRNKTSLIAEYVVVIAFASLLGVFRHFTKASGVPADRSYLQSFLVDPSSPLPLLITNSSELNQSYVDLSKWIWQRYAMSKNFSNLLMKRCINEPLKAKKVGGYVGLAPDIPITRSIGQVLTAAFNFTPKYFPSEDALKDFVRADGYGDPDDANPGMPRSLCFGVSFTSFTKGSYKYDMHYNVTGNPSWQDTVGLELPQVIKFRKEALDDYRWQNQLNSGFALIQELIAKLIGMNETKTDAYSVNAAVVVAPIQKYEIFDLYASTNGGDLSFFIMFPLMINFLKLVYNILNEKDKRITENLRNMGMSLYKHYASWYLFNTCVLLSTSLLWTVIVKTVFFRDGNFFLIWSLMLLPGLTLQGCAFFVSAFFVKAKSGIIAGLVLLFAFDLVRSAKMAITNPSETLVKWMAIAPADAVASASSVAVLLESYSSGISFSLTTALVNNFKFVSFLQVQALAALTFFVLGVYLDQVWPTEIGLKRHPLFFILDFCEKKPREEPSNELSQALIEPETDSPNFEEVEEQLKVQSNNQKTLKISNLRKIYSNGKVAVENLNLEMFSDQIFALLGHNGAGKTTTISMISGLLSQTSGSIEIMGRDSRLEAKEKRKILGVCPQTNPIYENLTCREHLVLYATIKQPDAANSGKPPVSELEIDTILQDLDLFDKKNYPASKLSGGQKRKLCVACAFIGGSKVILLDEPTSGMDTYARRYLWEMLKSYKKDRIIILSTHYMDEADYLGDRIGIMGKGKLITCGSSLFLKKRFGAGYDLTIVKRNPEVSTESIEKIILKYVPSAKKAGDISMELKYQLPSGESGRFEELFNDFEQNKEEYGIQTFGISLTTLEEVFLKVANIEEDEENKNQDPDAPKLESNKDKIERTIADEKFELNDIRVKNPSSVFWMHFGALCKKRFIYFKRDKRGLVCEIFLPIIIILVGMYTTTIQFIKESKSGVLSPNIVLLPDNSNEFWVGTSGVMNDFTTNLDKYLSGVENLKLIKSNASNIIDFDNELLRTQPNKPSRLYSVFVDKFDVASRNFTYTCFINTTAPYGIQICHNIMDNVIYKAVNGADSKIEVGIEPMPLTKQVASFQNTAQGFIAAILVSIAYAFIPASLIVIVVKERENNVKHQQIVSGVSILAYWLSNLLVDFVKYLVPASATVLILFLYDVEVYVGKDSLAATISMFVLFGPSLILFTYLFSFLFTSPSKAQFIIFLLNYLGGSILLIASFILRVLEVTRPIQINFIEFILRFLPIYDISFGLFSMANSQLWQMFFGLKEKPGPWNRYCALWSVVYMAALSVIYFFLIMIIETKASAVGKFFSNDLKQKLTYEGEDEDVTNERKEVESSDNYAVKVLNLMIEYVIFRKGACAKQKAASTKLAVKGVSFGVKRGECFGLLGTNGAGKTSTFKVLSGEIVPNYGLARIAGLNVETDMKSIGSLIGYCPQFDALLENLTAREHLELFAAIKGIPASLRPKLIENKLQQLNLKQYENVLAGTYSGGNKRKLSVAIALLGNPPIILLDEPSSGMDPEARRFMWSIVSQISTQNKTSSVILTTHSMEEAEALSSKLAIMVEGRVKCIGPVQQLKSKYGKGFEIEVKIRLPTNSEIEASRQLLAGLEERVQSQEQAAAVLAKLGFKNPEFEFCPSGKCNHFMLQVRSAHTARPRLSHLALHPDRVRPH